MGNAKASELLKNGQNFFFSEPPNIDEAIKSFREATECAPNWAEGFHWLGSAFRQQGEFEVAAKMYRKAIQLDTQDSRPLISLGECLTALERLPEAIQSYRAGIELKPHYAEADARLMLAEALERIDKIPEAISEWKRVAEMEGFYPSGEAPMIEARAKLVKYGIMTG